MYNSRRGIIPNETITAIYVCHEDPVRETQGLMGITCEVKYF